MRWADFWSVTGEFRAMSEQQLVEKMTRNLRAGLIKPSDFMKAVILWRQTSKETQLERWTRKIL